MKVSGGLAWRLALLVPLLAVGGNVRGQQAPEVEMSRGVEVGKSPVTISATFVCGPLEKEYFFDQKTYGKVSGEAPIRINHPPFVLYTSVLNPGFFRLAAALDALIAKDPTWKNSMVMVSDEKGAQFGGYKVEELAQRRTNVREMVLKNHLGHLNFFITAPPAKTLMPRLKLTGKQDMLLAALDNRTTPKVEAAVLTVQRLESDAITTSGAAKKAVDALVPRLGKP